MCHILFFLFYYLLDKVYTLTNGVFDSVTLTKISQLKLYKSFWLRVSMVFDLKLRWLF